MATRNKWLATAVHALLSIHLMCPTSAQSNCQWRSGNVKIKAGGFGTACCSNGCSNACKEAGCAKGNRFCDVKYADSPCTGANKCCQQKKDYCIRYNNINPANLNPNAPQKTLPFYSWDFPRKVKNSQGKQEITGPCTVDGVVHGTCHSQWKEISERYGGYINVAKYSCACHTGYSGPDCEVDSCANPMACNGHGKCNRGTPFYTCTCDTSAGWKGAHCNEKIDYCSLAVDACSGHGACVSDWANQTYTCVCKTAEGWEGPNCDQKINYCPVVACSGHGTCTSNWANQTYTCVCKTAEGWEGPNCAQKINYCPGNTSQIVGDKEEVFGPKGIACSGHGICVSDWANQTYTCVCKTAEGWGGPNCDQKINYCPGNTSRIVAEVEELFGPKDFACSGHGTCTSNWASHSYTCACDTAKGWGGPNCAQKINYCPGNISQIVGDKEELFGPKGIACSGHGICVSDWANHSYSCNCQTGYSGHACEVDSCADPMACSGHGKCNKGSPHYTCTCDTSAGWKGAHCNEKIDYCSLAVDACSGHGACVSDWANQTYTCVCNTADGIEWVGAKCDKIFSVCTGLDSDECHAVKSCTFKCINSTSCKCVDRNGNQISYAYIGFGAIPLVLLIGIVSVRRCRRQVRASLAGTDDPGLDDPDPDDEHLLDGSELQYELGDNVYFRPLPDDYDVGAAAGAGAPLKADIGARQGSEV